MHNDQNLSTSTPWPDGALRYDWTVSLFVKMSVTYGTKFLDQWAGVDPEEMKRAWAIDLGHLSNDELRTGVLALKTRPWPPTLPEFIALCRPPIDPMVAYQEAVEQGSRRERGEPSTWSSPVVYWAWRAIRSHDFTHLAYAVIKPRWVAALNAESGKALHEAIPDQRLALPAPGECMTSADEAKAKLAAFRPKILGQPAAGDRLEWAHKVLARRSQLSLGVIHAAEIALGMR